ncbi:hypothetical protein EVAR_55113_1 [Eumeta japonica]|uniref:Uncharacterized protein n=1 Tax=Eumeta variegata TaxID=151549 RepID=A0A4C1YDB3_EUMVA|nr:hypothetical protein EVAR_55113_1 [Eumeta japonica]
MGAVGSIPLWPDRELTGLWINYAGVGECSEELFNVIPATGLRYPSTRRKYHQHHLDGRRFTTVRVMRVVGDRMRGRREKSVSEFKMPATHMYLWGCECPWTAVTI